MAIIVARINYLDYFPWVRVVIENDKKNGDFRPPNLEP